MAAVCYSFGLSPAEYRDLSLAEQRAFVTLMKQIEKRNG